MVNGDLCLAVLISFWSTTWLVLGHLLYLIYINNLTEINLRGGTKITLYADDVLLFEEFARLLDDINKVGNWSCINFLTLNR